MTACLTAVWRAARGTALRVALSIVMSVAMVLSGGSGLQNATANGDTRSLSLHHTHRGDSITVVFRRNGRYDPEGLKTLNHFLRDWRTNEQVEMDPRLFDAVWEVARESGTDRTVHIISAYRSPDTNAMLHSRSSGVARESLHMQGKAMDFFIPGVPLEQIRVAGLRLQNGGVGFYPTSGSPFVHIDVGSVRHWPRMTREQLVRVFPDQRTVHIPSDGKPLAGYDLALADISKRGNAPSAIAVAARNNSRGQNVFARLFGSGTQNAQEPAAGQSPAAPVQTASVRTRSFTTANTPKSEAPLPVAAPARSTPAIALASLSAAVPLPKGRPAIQPVRVAAVASASRITAAMTPNEIIDARGFWQGVPDLPVENSAARRKPAEAVITTASINAPAIAEFDDAETDEEALADAFDHFDTPWLRAAILTPSVEQVMTATALGAPDATALRDFMAKPQATLALAFADAPHHGLSHKSFNGPAVHFLTTTVFVQRTAALR